MWLTSSSVGRKFIMALTGLCLVLFVTFHCLMNSVAILWPAAYNVICEFLGANWYALVASLGLAILFIIHIIYAVALTVMNRRARGNDRYLISKTPATVEWSSKNMFVLGVVIFAFLIVHLIQFWAKMQLVEMCGIHDVIPPAAGTLFIQEAFSLVWTPIVYIIGFVALWFHMNHGFWSMFQSIGWDNTLWIPRLKKIGCWWTSIVIALFVLQAIVFSVKAHDRYYITDPELQGQYAEMVGSGLTDILGPGAENIDMQTLKQMTQQVAAQPMMLQMVAQQRPGVDAVEMANQFVGIAEFINYLEGSKVIDIEGLKAVANGEAMPQPQMMPGMGQPQMAPAQEGAEAPEAQEAPVSAEQQAADEAPAEEPTQSNPSNK